MFYVVDGKAYLEESGKFIPVDIVVGEGEVSYLPAGEAVERPEGARIPLTMMEVIAKGPAHWPKTEPEAKVEPAKKAPAKRRPAKRAPAKKASK